MAKASMARSGGSGRIGPTVVLGGDVAALAGRVGERQTPPVEAYTLQQAAKKLGLALTTTRKVMAAEVKAGRVIETRYLTNRNWQRYFTEAPRAKT